MGCPAAGKLTGNVIPDFPGPNENIPNPIIIHECTVDTFANFLDWLNHKYVGISSLFTFTDMICIFDKQLFGATSG